jgi:hypothetical protein
MSRSIVWLSLLWIGCDGNLSGGKLGPALGESCEDERCRSGLVCGHEGVCVEDGDLGGTPEGDDCSASAECQYELVCSSDNFCAEAGGAGTGGAGDTCGSDDDCQAGHFCADDGTCTDVGIPFWEGATCPDDDLEGEFRVLFDVPDLPASGEIDFFSLPFPNDTRLGTTGHVDLSGFPDPGDGTAVGGLLDALEAGPAGWGVNPTVYFRFSRPQDLDTVTADGDAATVRWASLDEDADDYGDLTALQFFTRNTRGKYICQNWLGVSVADGRPLEEGHTYAVWLTKGIHDTDGDNAVRDNGFKVMVGDERPTDLTLGRAYDAYAPFREYVAREGLDLSSIAGAAVFTTGYPSRGVRYFREVTGGEDVDIAASDLTACDTGVIGPCDDGGARSCGSAGAGFTEVQGHLSVPRYRTDGGSVAYDPSSLRPAIQGMEDACFAMTVPAGTKPAAGWPIALYATDVGGTFRDAVSTGVAEALAAEGIATISLELPGHGERGTSYVDPANPPAWLGNQLQAGADAHAVLRFVQEWSVAAAASPTGADIGFDPDQVWFVGQGEGASTGIDFLAWTLGVKGGVLGNPAAFELHAFADQDAPVDVEHGLQAAFADSALTRWHPMLGLLQEYFEVADPVNNALAVVRDSATESKHLLVVDGTADDVLPTLSRQSAMRALYLPTAGPVLDDFGQTTTTFPVFENVSTDDGRRTAAEVQTADGHTALLTDAGIARTAAFLASGLAGSPTIGE